MCSSDLVNEYLEKLRAGAKIEIKAIQVSATEPAKAEPAKAEKK